MTRLNNNVRHQDLQGSFSIRAIGRKLGRLLVPMWDGSSGGFPLNISPLPTMQNRSRISSPF